MPTRNVPLLRQVLGHIEAHPEQHDQLVWAEKTECGTKSCFAGWSVRLGAPELSLVWHSVWDGFVGEDVRGMVGAAQVEVGDGETVHIQVVARELLGLSKLDAVRLFDEANSLDDLRRIVGELCDGVPS